MKNRENEKFACKFRGAIIEYGLLSAAMAQSVERRLGKAEVTGSIPVSSSVEEVRISVKFSLFLQYRKMLVT